MWSYRGRFVVNVRNGIPSAGKFLNMSFHIDAPFLRSDIFYGATVAA
jgi:hypothetical protein